jgi:mannan endo-1,4-beta-mannosidase
MCCVCRVQHAKLDEKLKFVTRWITAHVEDGEKELDKPVLTTEFGLSHTVEGFDHSHRELFYRAVFDTVYESAKRGGAGAGAFVWQLAVERMEEYLDDFAIVPSERPSLQRMIKAQSCRLAKLRQHGDGGGEARRALSVCAGFSQRGHGRMVERREAVHLP